MTAQDHYIAAMSLRSRVVSGETNETPIMAWASVCRECAKASNAKRRELENQKPYGRAELAWFDNLDRVWWFAKANVETLAKKAA